MRTTVTDSELASRAAAGDAHAFQSLLERHYGLLYRVAYRFVGNAPDAEDIAQDICVSLANKLGSFGARSRFTTWLYRVAVNAARDALRRRTTDRKLHDTYGEISTLTAAGQADRQARLGWVYNTLATLDDGLRETALLVLAEGLSHAEVGEILGVRESTISWRMHEMRKKLKALAGTYND